MRGVVVAGQRQAVAAGFACHFLQDGIGAALGHAGGSGGVVETGVAALRLRGIQQRTGLHVELFHLDVRGQGITLHRLHIQQCGEIIAKMTLRERLQETPFKTGCGRGRIQ